MMYDEETDTLRPSVVSDPPKKIWLNVGEPDQDCLFKDLDEVTWCDDAQFPSDIKYVLHSDHEAALAAAVAKERERLCDAILAEAADSMGDAKALKAIVKLARHERARSDK